MHDQKEFATMHDRQSPQTRRIFAFLNSLWPVPLLLSIHFCLGLSAASRKTLTFDEGLHLASGYSYWSANDYRSNAESGNWPQRWAALPVWLEGYRFPPPDEPTWLHGQRYDFANRFLYDSGNNADAMILQARAMIGLLSVALGAVVYFWSRQLFGGVGSLISLMLYTFSPTMLSHGFLITADLASALFFCAAAWAVWTLLHRVSIFAILAAAISMAGLLLSKFSGVLIVPMGLVLLAVRCFHSQPLLVVFGQTYELRGRLKQLAAIAGVMVVEILAVGMLIWASYGFRYSTLNPSASHGATVDTSWEQFTKNVGAAGPIIQFLGEHRLLPEPFLYGLSYTLSTTEVRRAFLNGEFRTHGWISFFPYSLLVKTPLDVFAVLALAAIGAWFFRGTSNQTDPASQASIHHWYPLTPLMVLLSVYWIVSLTSHINIGQRHLLPTYPPMFILAGAATCWFLLSKWTSSPLQNGKRVEIAEPHHFTKAIRIAQIVLCVSLALAALDAVWVWPDYLAYFNILAGGPAQGYRHLVDSSLDWGQDLKELKRWLDAHPQDAKSAVPVYLSYFGTAWPTYYGIEATRLPGFFDVPSTLPPQALIGGTYCISATMLPGVYLPFPGKWNARYEQFYQLFTQAVAAYRNAGGNEEQIRQIAASFGTQNMNPIFHLYEQLRFARLCAFLRQREPDANAGHSILIYRLSDADVEQAIAGPPVELLPDCEPEAADELPFKVSERGK
ncbi:MAG TPA: glycosyltransferase family 39 protein [Pirellulales bacterium]|nr:glycosyltransferase family 39 protein [Pirellulales bacterium]